MHRTRKSTLSAADGTRGIAPDEGHAARAAHRLSYKEHRHSHEHRRVANQVKSSQVKRSVSLGRPPPALRAGLRKKPTQRRETQAFLWDRAAGPDDTHTAVQRLHQYRIKIQGEHDLRCTPRFKVNYHVRLCEFDTCNDARGSRTP